MKLFLLAVITLLSVPSFSQKPSSTFLQNYKFRTPGFTIAELTGKADGVIFSENQIGTAFSINPNFIGERIISTDAVLAKYSLYASTSFNHNNNNIGSALGSQSNLNINFSASKDVKHYKSLNYFQQGFGWLFYSNSNKNANLFLNSESKNNGSLTYTVGVGKGRLENVSDAQVAYNILNNLQSNNLLNTNFTDEDVTGLAKTITKINTTRVFDFRRRRIFQLKQIDSFLVIKNIAKNNSIDYFTTITDNWFYAFNPYRNQGTEKYIRLQPGIGADYYRTKFKNSPYDSIEKQSNLNFTANLSIGIDKATAINIKRQLNKGISISNIFITGNGKVTNNNITIASDAGSSMLTSLYAYIQRGYFPNTRTTIFTNLNNQTFFLWQNLGIVNNTNGNINANYFVNYNLRLFLNTGATLIVNKSSDVDINAVAVTSFNLGLSYFIR